MKNEKPKINNSPVLYADKTECKVGEVVLRIDQTIEYRGSADEVTSIGKIKSFKYAGYGEENTASVWMNIQEMDKLNQSEFISVSNWYASHTTGLFKKNTSDHVTNKKQKITSKRPF